MGTEGGSLKAGNGQESPVHTQHQILDGFGQRLVVAHHDTNYARKAGRHFRSLGWKVHCTDTAGAARLARRKFSDIVRFSPAATESSGQRLNTDEHRIWRRYAGK